MFSAGLFPAIAQGTDRQGAGGILVAWRSSGLAARDRPGREGHRRTAGPLRQGVQREGRQGARRPVHARGRDRGRDGEVTRGRDAIVGRFSGIFKESGGDTLAVDTDSLRFLGTDLAIEEGTASLIDRAGAASRDQPVQRDLRPAGRPLAPRPDPRRAARRGLPARAAPATGMDARRVGQRERRRGRQDHTASGRTTATSCSGSSTSRSRGASP